MEDRARLAASLACPGYTFEVFDVLRRLVVAWFGVIDDADIDAPLNGGVDGVDDIPLLILLDGEVETPLAILCPLDVADDPLLHATAQPDPRLRREGDA